MSDNDGQYNGLAGYQSSWKLVQTSVNKLKVSEVIPVSKRQRGKRQRRHLAKRRVLVDMRRDVLIYNAIRNAQKFQLEYEEACYEQNPQTLPDRVLIDAEEAQKPLRKRRDKHYDFFPQFVPLPSDRYRYESEPEQHVEDDANGVCIISEPLIFATECREDSMYLPASLSEEIDSALSKLADDSNYEKPSFLLRFFKKHVAPLF